MRIIILVVGMTLGIWYVMRYAGKVKNDPSKSLVADMKEANEKHFLADEETSEAPEFTTRRKVILGLFWLSFLFMIIGVIPWSDIGINAIATRYWWFAELAALFMVMGSSSASLAACAKRARSTPSSTARATWWAWRWWWPWRAASR